MSEEYGIHVKTASGTVEVLKPGIDRRVTALETAIASAQTAATKAQSTADGAQTAATKAQSTADGAQTAATKAQSTADGKAPKDHATTTTTYGAGNGSNYGHVKLSDAVNSTSGVSGGIAATPAAVKTAYDKAVAAETAASGFHALPIVLSTVRIDYTTAYSYSPNYGTWWICMGTFRAYGKHGWGSPNTAIALCGPNQLIITAQAARDGSGTLINVTNTDNQVRCIRVA